MRSRNVGAVALVILLGLVIGTLGLVEADLYAVGVLLLFLGGVGAAVLIGEYLIRYFSAKRHVLAAACTTRTMFSVFFLATSFALAAPHETTVQQHGGPRVPLGGAW